MTGIVVCVIITAVKDMVEVIGKRKLCYQKR